MDFFSLHTHTSALDGCHSVLQMVEQAKRIGFKALGISEHFIVYPNISETEMFWAAKNPKNPQIKPYHHIYSDSFEEAVAKIQPVYEQIEELRQIDSFPIFKGLEVDFFDYVGWNKGFENALAVLKPDYVIGACHFSIVGDKLLNMHDILKLSSSDKDCIVADYWQRQQQAVKSGYFDWMAHPDLYKRHGIGGADKFLPYEKQTISLMFEHQVGAEINTASLNKKDYKLPDLMRLLRLIAQFNVPTILNDDAHHIAQLGQNYETAFALAKEAGVKTFLQPLQQKNRFALEKVRFENQR